MSYLMEAFKVGAIIGGFIGLSMTVNEWKNEHLKQQERMVAILEDHKTFSNLVNCSSFREVSQVVNAFLGAAQREFREKEKE